MSAHYPGIPKVPLFCHGLCRNNMQQPLFHYGGLSYQKGSNIFWNGVVAGGTLSISGLPAANQLWIGERLWTEPLADMLLFCNGYMHVRLTCWSSTSQDYCTHLYTYLVCIHIYIYVCILYTDVFVACYYLLFPFCHESSYPLIGPVASNISHYPILIVRGYSVSYPWF